MKITYLSKIFNPTSNILPSETKFRSKSLRLLYYNKLISPSSFGTYTIMPMLQRSLDKLINIINKEMNHIDAQKLTMPSLGRSSIWEKSGRWTSMGNELYKVIDNESNELCLQPTHEEEVTNLLATFNPLNIKQMPILFYQITSKFRNELSPQSGLLRCREFLMKDLYSFDSNEEKTMITYNRVLQQYHRIFDQLNVEYFCVEADCGRMGGTLSHEFHIPSKIGEDVIMLCDKCNKGFNKEISTKTEKNLALSCIDESCNGSLSSHSSIEIGHCFLLGDQYSKNFDLHYKNDKNLKQSILMGCYGIGVTRLLASCVEVLSEKDKLRWPRLLAPYNVAVLLQKTGAHDSTPDELKSKIIDKLTQRFINHSCCPSNILVDDTNVTIGRKLSNADSLGIPFAIVVKDKEVLETVNLYTGIVNHLPLEDSIGSVSDSCFLTGEKVFNKEKCTI